jgi:hypothetical protein
MVGIASVCWPSRARTVTTVNSQSFIWGTCRAPRARLGPASGRAARFQVTARGCPPISSRPYPQRPSFLRSATTRKACPARSALRSASGSPAGCQRPASRELRIASLTVTLPAARTGVAADRSPVRPDAGSSTACSSPASGTGGASASARDRPQAPSHSTIPALTGQATNCACQARRQMNTPDAQIRELLSASSQNADPHVERRDKDPPHDSHQQEMTIMAEHRQRPQGASYFQPGADDRAGIGRRPSDAGHLRLPPRAPGKRAQVRPPACPSTTRRGAKHEKPQVTNPPRAPDRKACHKSGDTGCGRSRRPVGSRAS